MSDTINFRSPKTLGCSVASSAIIQSLREKFQKSEIIVYTKTPDLFIGLTEIDKLVDLNNEIRPANYDVDLEDYLDVTKPQSTEPFRHLIDHMFEISEKQLESQLPGRLNR